VPIRFYSKYKETTTFDGLLDSGSDDILIPIGITEYLKLTLGEKLKSDSAGGKIETYKIKIGVILGQGGRDVDFGIVDAKATEIDIPILIGRYPIFEEFQVVFEEYKKRVKLIPKEEVLKKNDIKKTKSLKKK